MLTLKCGKVRRTRPNRWFSKMPVWVWPLHGAFGVSLRVGDTIRYLFVAQRRRSV
ncbi:hypothetical protein GCM10007977_063630 [Dactylosporangium sucinum]|uniref:Uncharacterized protein n=2 Tax=Dactylosporangium sucinum TaxID=1424081 RepID=A0A917U3W8_9ACTN|nr:hypothetical protein GCM10007977_063630 [Dactylosporangium sucinum]